MSRHMNLTLHPNKISYKIILSVLLFLISPVISLLFTPLSTIPATIVALILTRSECASATGESLCGFGTQIILIYVFNIFISILLISLILFLLHKNRSLLFKIVLVIFLSIYQTSLTLLFFHYSGLQQAKISRQREDIYKATINTQFSDLKIVEKTRDANFANTKKYTDTTFGYALYYPNNFRIEEHQKPVNLYFRPLNYNGITKNTLSTTGIEGNEFFSLQNINFNYSQFRNDQEALNYALNKIKTNIKNEKNFPVRLNKIVETSTTTQGWKLFFIEDSHGQDNQKDQFFNELSIIIKKSEGYLFWEGYSTFKEGNLFLRDIIETIEKY